MHPPRLDHPGAWWLLTNRGLAKRPVFETRGVVERFCEFLADVVDGGDLEVHAFTFLTTHFHLFGRSPRGEISRAMQRVTNRFVRWFNRTHRRDGSLFRGRFHGRRLDDDVHWETALCYVDLNPVRAGLVARPSDHLHGSARAYRWGGGPEWLRRGEVERTIRAFEGSEVFRPERYDAYALRANLRANAHIVDRLLRSPSSPAPPLADLLLAASARERDWMRWKAHLADGSVPGVAFVSPDAVLRVGRTADRLLRPVTCAGGSVSRDLVVGLLRSAAGLTQQEVADLLGIGRSTVHRGQRRHEERLERLPGYGEVVGRLLGGAVRRCLPVPVLSRPFPLRVAAGGGIEVEV